MAAHTQISLEEYLRTSFEGPDREFLDGEIVERNVGDYWHGKVQACLAALFRSLGAYSERCRSAFRLMSITIPR